MASTIFWTTHVVRTPEQLGIVADIERALKALQPNSYEPFVAAGLTRGFDPYKPAESWAGLPVSRPAGCDTWKLISAFAGYLHQYLMA